MPIEVLNQVYESVFEEPSMAETQAWEQKIETLLRTPRSTLHESFGNTASYRANIESSYRGRSGWQKQGAWCSALGQDHAVCSRVSFCHEE